MDDRSIPVRRWSVMRVCESSRHQRQLLAQAYFPQIRQPLDNVATALCRLPHSHRAAARIAAGA